MIGKTISHYEIINKLGEGGMGVVYRARDTKLDRQVAIKLLPPHLSADDDAKQRFIHEAKAASSLDHPNICTIYEIDETDEGRLFIAMACYEGETLRRFIQRGVPEFDDALDIAMQIVSGLATAHEKGIVHRDIKPRNIFITSEGRVKILDFGLAKLAGQTKITKTGSTIGTVSYMSPEQARGDEIDARSDIFSLGVVFYELFCGALPFKGEHEAAILYSIMNTDPAPLSDHDPVLPSEIESIIGRMLAKKPEKRFQSMEDLKSGLKALREKRQAASYEKTHAASAHRSRGQRWWLPAGAVLAVLIAVFALKPLFFESGPIASPKPLIVISFENQTGDPSYDYLREAIPNLLISSLEQSKYLSVITWERLYDLLEQLGKGDTRQIDKDTGFELCRLEGIPTIVIGSFAKAGNTFATDVKVLDVDTKELLKSASAQGDGVESILKHQIDDLSKEIARSTGLSDRKIEKNRQPVQDVATASMEAYSFYLQGMEDYLKFYFLDAITSFQRAVLIDSTFASAHLYLAWSHERVRDWHQARLSYERAMRFADQATERERLYIEAAYASSIERDDEKSMRILRTITARFPKEKNAHGMLSIRLRYRGRYDESIAEARETLRLDPKNGYIMNQLAYLFAQKGEYDTSFQYLDRYAALEPDNANPVDSMSEIYFMMGRLDDALAKCRETLEIKPDFGASPRIAYIYALKGEFAEALRWSDGFIEYTAHVASRAVGYVLRAYYLVQLGRLDEARSDCQAALRLIDPSDNPTATKAYFLMGVIDQYRGDYKASREEYRKALAAARTSGFMVQVNTVMYYEAMTDAFLAEGKLDSARSYVQKMEAHLPEVRRRNFRWYSFLAYPLSIMQAKTCLQGGEVKRALAVCEHAPHMLTPMLNPEYASAINMPPEQDVLARALVAAGRIDSAIAVYKNMITFDPASSDRRLVNPRYYYRLGCLYEQQARTREALVQYEKFLEIFKDADPVFTEVPDARRRLAALKQATGT